MKNYNELIFILKDLKNELDEAYERGMHLSGEDLEKNVEYRNNLMNEILRLAHITEEYAREQERVRLVKLVDNAEDAVLEGDTQEVFGQKKLVEAFNKRFDEIATKLVQATPKIMSTSQENVIKAGVVDRLNISIDREFMAKLSKFNQKQADEVIKILKKVSFYNQRVRVTEAVKGLRHREEYETIVLEVRKSINDATWHEANQKFLSSIGELQAPTDAQIRMIANVSRYPETAYTLKSDYDLDIQDFEDRPNVEGELKLYYTMNWEKYKTEVKNRMNRESASNFLQTWSYLTNLYEGKQLESHERNHLRSLYIQLGEYESTRPSHINVIQKYNFNVLVSELEKRVKLNKHAMNMDKNGYAQAMMDEQVKNVRYARQTKKVKLTKEQEDARDLFSFVRNIYAVVGMEIPEEMRAILPDSYSQNRQQQYVGVNEQHLPEFRRLVWEQRDVVKNVYHQYTSNDSKHVFNWGAFLAEQPVSVLEALGIADFM